MSKYRVALLVLLAVPGAASAQSMNADLFLTKANALMAKGPLALFSGDYRLLKKEGEAAGAALRLERKALLAAGKPTPYCPPAAKGSLSSDELIGGIKAIPAAERRSMDTKTAMRRVLAHKYPC